MPTSKARIRLMIYDGPRQPFSEKQSVLLRVLSASLRDSGGASLLRSVFRPVGGRRADDGDRRSGDSPRHAEGLPAF
jgi:hypothetical protein